MFKLEVTRDGGTKWHGFVYTNACSKAKAKERFKQFVAFFNQRHHHPCDQVKEGQYRVVDDDGVSMHDRVLHQPTMVYCWDWMLQADKVCAMAYYA
jgi:hypothetical protein